MPITRESERSRHRAYYKTHKDRTRKYYEDHKDIIKERSKKNYEKNREDIIKKQKEYYISHREEIREYVKKYYTDRRDKMRERSSEYRKNHLEHCREVNKIYNREKSRFLVRSGRKTFKLTLPKRDKQSHCEVCGKNENRYSKPIYLVYHHWDDNNPSWGVWVCIHCHGLVESMDKNKDINLLVEKYNFLKSMITNNQMQQKNTEVTTNAQ